MEHDQTRTQPGEIMRFLIVFLLIFGCAGQPVVPSEVKSGALDPVEAAERWIADSANRDTSTAYLAEDAKIIRLWRVNDAFFVLISHDSNNVEAQAHRLLVRKVGESWEVIEAVESSSAELLDGF